MILEKFLVTDRVAVVTGGGRGIGAATAVALAEAGADVVVSSRTGSQLAEVVAQVEKAGRRAVAVEADLADLGAVAGLADTADEAFGRLDIVVNNVGGAMPAPSPDLAPPPGGGVPLQRLHRPRPHPGGAAVAAGERARVGGQHLVGHGPGQRPGLRGLRHRQGGAVALHPPRRPRPRPPGAGQRHRVGSVATSALDIVLDDESLRTTMEDQTPLRRIGDTSDIAPACCSSPRTPARTSPARCWRPTAGSTSPTSTWASRTCRALLGLGRARGQVVGEPPEARCQASVAEASW